MQTKASPRHTRRHKTMKGESLIRSPFTAGVGRRVKTTDGVRQHSMAARELISRGIGIELASANLPARITRGLPFISSSARAFARSTTCPNSTSSSANSTAREGDMLIGSRLMAASGHILELSVLALGSPRLPSKSNKNWRAQKGASANILLYILLLQL